MSSIVGDKLGLNGLGGVSLRVDHKAAKEYAIDRKESSPYMTSVNNLAACYPDLTERHKKLLELAEASLKATIGEITDMSVTNMLARHARKLEADAALRAFIDEERKRTNGLP